MNVLVSATLLLSSIATACKTTPTASSLEYSSADARRTRMTFETDVTFDLPTNASIATNISQFMASDAGKQALTEAEAQTAFIYSALTTHPRWEKNQGAPHNRPVIKPLAVSRSKTPGKGILHYRYQDLVVFKNKIIEAGGERDVTFILPKQPSAIFAAGIPKNGNINRCTDPHYNTEDDNWYFWNPYQDKCPYKDNLREYTVGVTAHLKALPSKERTYPEYDMLYQDKKIYMTYIFGINEDFAKRDIGRKSYEDAIKLLVKELNFKVTDNSHQYQKTLVRNQDGMTTTIDLHLLSQQTQEFMDVAANGMRKSDIFIYTGHSGLGGYLSLDRFREAVSKRFTLPKNKYQVYFFNGCSTYSYYNYDFMEMKRTPEERASDPENIKDRSKYLDVITNGIAMYLDGSPSHDFAIIKGLIGGKRPSWQEMLQEMYDSDPEYSALTMVNGDGDNPKNPGHR